jgi:hypothetical protein
MNDTILDCEIPAVKFDPATGSPKRLLFVPNINVFWNENRDWPEWSATRIAEAMSWSDFDPDDALNEQPWNRLVIASPDYCIEHYRNVSYHVGWRRWAELMANGRKVSWNLSHDGFKDPHCVEYGASMDSVKALAGATIYPKEFFDNYDPDINHAWAEIVMASFGYHNDFQSWWGNGAFISKPIVQRFIDGDSRVTTSLNNDGNNEIMEVYILEQANGQLKARAFTVPRRLDPYGHLE